MFERQTGQSVQCHPQRIREWHPQLPASDLSGMNLAKLFNRDAIRVVSIMYQVYAKHATKSQGMMKHFRRLKAYRGEVVC